LARKPKSLRLDAGKLDDLAPFLGFIGDQFPEIGRRTRKQRCAEIGKPRFSVTPLYEPARLTGSSTKKAPQ
jgi:hypothetical protein